MAKLQLTETQWEEAREYWETTPGSANSKAKYLAAKFGGHPNTFTMKARQHEWFSPDVDHIEAVETVREAAPEAAPDWMNIEDKMAYESRIAELERELAESRATAEQLRPDVDITDRLFTTVDDVIRFYGVESTNEWYSMTDIALQEMAAMNKQRMRRGLPTLTNADMTPSDRDIQAEANKIIADRRREVPTTGVMNRAVKMVNPRKFCDHPAHAQVVDRCYQHGNLVPIPLEPTTNNLRGSQYDATHRYLEKGFKLTRPLLCFAAPCYEPAVVDARGKLQYGGYCSEDHRRRTGAESDKDRASVGAITRESLAVG